MAVFLMKACSNIGDAFHGSQLLQMVRALGIGVWCKAVRFASIRTALWSLAGIRTRAHGAWLTLTIEQGSWETFIFFALGEAHLLWTV